MARWRVDPSFDPGIDERGRFRQMDGMQREMDQRMQDALFRQKYGSNFADEPRRLVTDIERQFDRMDRDSPSPKRFGQTTRTSFEDPGTARFTREFSPVAQPQFFTMGRSPNRMRTDERQNFQTFSPSPNTGLYTTRPQNRVTQQTAQSTVPPDGYMPDRSCFVTDENGARRYKVEFEVGEGFEAENVRVIANGNKITVKVNKLEKDNFSTLTREFTRTVEVPDNVNPKEVKAFFQNGMLILEAPVNPPPLQRVLQSPERFRQPVINKNVTTTTSINPGYPINQPRPDSHGTALSYGYNDPRPAQMTSNQNKGHYQSTGRQPEVVRCSPEKEDRGSFAPSLSRKPSGAGGVKTSSAQISLAQPREKTPPSSSGMDTGSVRTYVTQYQQPPGQFQKMGFQKEKSPVFGQKFVMEIFVGKDVQPSDINVHTQDGVVHVSAEWQEERAVGQPVSHRKFHKELPLPEGVDPQAVTAHIMEGGKLMLEAPYLPYGLSDV